MPKQELIIPEFNKKGFTCPHCNFNAQQKWKTKNFFDNRGSDIEGLIGFGNISWAHCQHCNKFSIWYKGEIVYPEVVQVDDPN